MGQKYRTRRRKDGRGKGMATMKKPPNIQNKNQGNNQGNNQAKRRKKKIILRVRKK